MSDNPTTETNPATPTDTPTDTHEAVTASINTVGDNPAALDAAVATKNAGAAPTDDLTVELGYAKARLASLEGFASDLANNLPSLATIEDRVSALEDFGAKLIASFNDHFMGKIALPEAPATPASAI